MKKQENVTQKEEKKRPFKLNPSDSDLELVDKDLRAPIINILRT